MCSLKFAWYYHNLCVFTRVFCFYWFDSWGIVFNCSLFVMSCIVTRGTLVPKLVKIFTSKSHSQYMNFRESSCPYYVARIWKQRSHFENASNVFRPHQPLAWLPAAVRERNPGSSRKGTLSVFGEERCLVLLWLFPMPSQSIDDDRGEILRPRN